MPYEWRGHDAGRHETTQGGANTALAGGLQDCTRFVSVGRHMGIWAFGHSYTANRRQMPLANSGTGVGRGGFCLELGVGFEWSTG